MFQASLRDAIPLMATHPALETPGYFQMSLQDRIVGTLLGHRGLRDKMRNASVPRNPCVTTYHLLVPKVFRTPTVM